ncbi:MAG: hypothetical protein JWO36_2913 [Myxococcales bacterium]|nr:hypothetical protein [Myxococcales bacterium]
MGRDRLVMAMTSSDALYWLEKPYKSADGDATFVMKLAEPAVNPRRSQKNVRQASRR